MEGIIIENKSNLFRIKVKNEIYDANARGKFKNKDLVPVVGDKVKISILDENKKLAVIEEILPRSTYIKRPKMSNVTQLILVISSKNPKPDLLLLDKQLAFAEFLGIKAVIVLNKTDLDKKKEFKKIEKVYTKIGYPVIKTVAKKEIHKKTDNFEIKIFDEKIKKNQYDGISELTYVLKNNINVFSGNSGVGKSTLINAIFCDNITDEGEISLKNKRGKNTTTSTRLYEIDENTYIADTPRFFYF